MLRSRELEILDRLELGAKILESQSRKFLKGRSWSRTFYLRLRNPGSHYYKLYFVLF